MIPDEIVAAANREWETRGNARRGAKREPLLVDGKVVGFTTPHETRWGWRLGPIFVLPEYRRRGAVVAAYALWQHVTMVAFIADTNTASYALHVKVGFVRWKRGNGGWFMRREPKQ